MLLLFSLLCYPLFHVTQFYFALITFICFFPQKSLAATIKKARPELLSSIPTSKPAIAEEIPPNYFKKHVEHIEDIGTPITACFLTKVSADPTNW
jgi:hypothetical protein